MWEDWYKAVFGGMYRVYVPGVWWCRLWSWAIRRSYLRLSAGILRCGLVLCV